METLSLILCVFLLSMASVYQNSTPEKYEETLMISAEDVHKSSFMDWFKAHSSFSKPLHRYSGELNVSISDIIFRGKDEKENKNYELKVLRENIKEVKLGFDSTFRRIDDRQLGLKDFEPLRVTFIENETEKIVYIFAGYKSKGSLRSSDNKALYESLVKK